MISNIKVFLGGICVALWAVSAPAQTLVAGREAPLQEAPSSSIDLLKQSAGASNVAAPASSVSSAAGAAPAVSAASSGSLAEEPRPAAVQTPAVAVSGAATDAAAASVPEKTVADVSPAVTQALSDASAAGAAAKPVSAPASAGVSSQTSAKKAVAARRVAAAKAKRQPVRKTQPAVKPTVPSSPAVTQVERDIEQNNALLPDSVAAEEEVQSAEEAAAEAELEYAARMLDESKKNADPSGRNIPPQAAKNTSRTVPVKNKPFNPNSFRPGVQWLKSESNHFTIYTQKRDRGISSSNMAMTFESAYDTLRRFIPWMMSGKVRVFVYQDYQSYLKHEPQAKAWTRALAYPTRGEIVVYDEPGKTRELKETFTHELTHIFTQQFFDKHHTNRIMTPAWLDEGLAVFMEDQAYNGRRGGPWSQDLKTLDFRPSPQQQFRPASFGFSSSSDRVKHFSREKKKGKPVIFMPFDEFMQEGSLESMEAKNKTQDWYFQAYAMVRFLLNPAGGASPSNRMQFQQFTTLMAQGEPLRNSSGFLVKDKKGQTVYQPYSAEKAMAKAYRYSTPYNFEEQFWRWADGVKKR